MPSARAKALVVLDFDGFLIDSYELIRATFAELGFDVGDSDRFRKRRKFLKYLGGGKEILRNLVTCSLPRKKAIRAVLTERYEASGRVFEEFVPLLNEMIASPELHVGILSRNFALHPGRTIRTVLRSSGVDERHLDFVIPIPIGADKRHILEALWSEGYRGSIFGADEIGDYEATRDLGYEVVMASYGFDKEDRLHLRGKVPLEIICTTPAEAVSALRGHVARV